MLGTSQDFLEGGPANKGDKEVNQFHWQEDF
jgi:hypothetical protein